MQDLTPEQIEYAVESISFRQSYEGPTYSHGVAHYPAIGVETSLALCTHSEAVTELTEALKDALFAVAAIASEPDRDRRVKHAREVLARHEEKKL